MCQSACFVFNPIIVDNYVMARLKAIHFSWLGSELLVCCLAHRSSSIDFLLLHILVSCLRSGISIVGKLTESASPRFLFIMAIIIMMYLFGLDDSLTS